MGVSRLQECSILVKKEKYLDTSLKQRRIQTFSMQLREQKYKMRCGSKYIIESRQLL